MNDRLKASLKRYIAETHGEEAVTVYVDVDSASDGCDCCGVTINIDYDLWWTRADGTRNMHTFNDLDDLLEAATAYFGDLDVDDELWDDEDEDD